MTAFEHFALHANVHGQREACRLMSRPAHLLGGFSLLRGVVLNVCGRYEFYDNYGALVFSVVNARVDDFGNVFSAPQ